MARRVASPVFVGRKAELAALRAALDDPGRISAVLVGGEAGAGKSRLVAEFTAEATKSGARVLTGSCVALGAESLPYAPFMGALGQLAADLGLDGIDELVGPSRADLSRLVPELRRPGDDHRPAEAADRAVLFQVVLRTLEAASAERPLVLVIEDLHWADGSSRELLGYVVDRLRAPVLVVGTYRIDEVHRRHPLRPLLAHAARSERVARLELAPLTPAEMTEQLQAIAGSGLPAAVVDAVVARADGNPFFAEELLAAGGGDELPPNLAEVLAARLAALPEEAQTVVQLAAVGGPRVGHDLLAAVTGGRADPAAGLREAISHHVLVAEPSACYVFRHALLAEAAYAELLPAERAALHGAYANALASHPEWATTTAGIAGIAGELAYHYAAAQDTPRALAASVAAAAAATESYAFAEAHGLYEQALELWSRVPEAGQLAGCDRATLLQRAAESAVLAGAAKRAVVLWRAALDAWDARADPARAALMYERLARVLWMGGEGEESLAAMQAAVALMPDGPSAERAQVLGGEARVLMLLGRFQEASTRAEAAIAVARAAGARREEGYALNSLGTYYFKVGQADRAVALLEEALAIAEGVGSLEDMRRAYNNLAAALEDGLGDPARAADVAVKGASRLEDMGYADGAVSMLACAANSFLTVGAWDEVNAVAETVLAGTPSDVSAWRTRMAAGTVALRRGEVAAADLHLGHARRLCSGLRDTDYRANLAAVQAESALGEGRVTEARVLVDAALDDLADTDAHDSVRLLVSLGLRAEADALAARLSRGRAGPVDGDLLRRVDALIERLGGAAALTGDPPPSVTVHGRALMALCRAEWERARGVSVARRWKDVATAWLAIGRPYEAAYARWRQAEASLTAGEKEEATDVLREALSLAAGLGAAPLVADIEGLARRGRIRLVAASDGRPPPGGPMGLTKREAEVLALVAAGHTNAQIADALFMSEKTASVHVSRILTKLGVSNRSQAAAVAHRLDLVK